MDNDTEWADRSWLEAAIDYQFKDGSLCELALTHPSFAFETAAATMPDNQRLEYLGDAVLGLVVARALYLRHTGFSEGRLSRLKSALVCEETLYEVALYLHLGDYLHLGKGERASAGAAKPSILSDALEALLGAVFLDGGYEVAEEVVLGLLEPRFDKAYKGLLVSDHKTALQEWLQAKGKQPPSYLVVDRSGPPHDMRFIIEVKVEGVSLGCGVGSSKKEAQQVAAARALEVLQQQEDPA